MCTLTVSDESVRTIFADFRAHEETRSAPRKRPRGNPDNQQTTSRAAGASAHPRRAVQTATATDGAETQLNSAVATAATAQPTASASAKTAAATAGAETQSNGEVATAATAQPTAATAASQNLLRNASSIPTSTATTAGASVTRPAVQAPTYISPASFQQHNSVFQS